jgi:transcriptional regulator with XRE-family HTH domain
MNTGYTHPTLIPKRLKGLRLGRGLQVQALASRTGLSEAQVHRLERGERPDAPVDAVALVALALNTTVEYLVGLTDDTRSVRELTVRRDEDGRKTTGPLAEGWISGREAEDLTGYTPAYLRRLASRGRVEACKVGGAWVFHEESLLSYRQWMDDLGPEKHSPWRKDLAARRHGRRRG